VFPILVKERDNCGYMEIDGRIILIWTGFKWLRI
jgi:hypothetical protein